MAGGFYILQKNIFIDKNSMLYTSDNVWLFFLFSILGSFPF